MHGHLLNRESQLGLYPRSDDASSKALWRERREKWGVFFFKQYIVLRGAWRGTAASCQQRSPPLRFLRRSVVEGASSRNGAQWQKKHVKYGGLEVDAILADAYLFLRHVLPLETGKSDCFPETHGRGALPGQPHERLQ